MEELNITGDESFNSSTPTALLILSSSLDREIVNAYKLSFNVFPEGHSVTGTIVIKVFQNVYQSYTSAHDILEDIAYTLLFSEKQLKDILTQFHL